MVAISFAFNDFNLVMDSFQSSGMDWIITSGWFMARAKAHHSSIALLTHVLGLIGPNVLELVFKNQDGINDSVQS